MKRVVILNHSQEHHGTYYRCLFLGKGLAKRGYHVEMICASGRNFDLLIRRQKVAVDFEIITLPRIKYHRYFTGQLLRMLITTMWILFLRFDVCIAFTVAQPQIAVPAWGAKVIRKKKLVVDWDDMWGGGFADEHGSLVSKILTFCERYFLIYADQITFVSEAIEKEIELVSKKYPVVRDIPKRKIPNGANTAQISVRDKALSRRKLGVADAVVLLSIGNTYTDSLGLMLEAFETVHKNCPEATLYLVGEAELPDRFNHLCKKNRNCVRLIGNVPLPEIVDYMGAADVLLLPMDDNPIERARFPMRLGDYLCARRPIVSNAVGEVKYYLSRYDAGKIPDVSSVEDFANSILTVLNDRVLTETISHNARKLADGDLNWEGSFDAISIVLEEIMESGS